MRKTTPELETTIMAYKYCFGMHLKFLKMAKSYMKGTRPYEEFTEKAKSYSEKCKQLDYEIYTQCCPVKSGNIHLTSQATERWREFAKQETEYRNKIMHVQMTQAEFLLSSDAKKLNGMIHNSAFRQSTIIAAITKDHEEQL